MDLIVVGAGGHAAEIDDYIRYNNHFCGEAVINVIGFIDDDSNNYSRYSFSAPLLGSISNHKVIVGVNYIIGIASLLYRSAFVAKLTKEGAHFVSFIHCSAYVSESAIIGIGSIVGPNATVGPNVKVGNFTLINARCSLGHDTVVGDYNIISPNTCFSGFTKIGDENLFGINCATLPGIKIGNRNKISAGMIVDTNLGNNTVVFHRFKERVIAVPRQDSHN